MEIQVPKKDLRQVSQERKANVLYDFEAQEEDELSLKAGEIVSVLQQINQAWWMGMKGEKIGIFPTNYVELIDEHHSDPLANRVSRVSKQEDHDTVQVLKWLTSIGMEKYINHFLENGYDDLEVIEDINMQDLIQVGILDESDQEIIIQAASKFKLEPNETFDCSESSSSSSETREETPSPIQEEPNNPLRHNGFLSKQGGSIKGWRKRWVVCEDGDIKYYKLPSDKEPAGIIKNYEILYAARNEIESKKDPRYAHCFDVATSREGRVFVFCSESEKDTQKWIEIISGVIKKGISNRSYSEVSTPSSTLSVENTSISNQDSENINENSQRKDSLSRTFTLGPDRRESEIPGLGDRTEKEGWLKKMGNNVAKDWKRRYVAIKGGRIFYYRSYEHFVAMDPINFIEVLTTSVKPVPAPGKFRFELVTLNRSFWFQAETQAEMMEWIVEIQTAIGNALTAVQSQKAENNENEGSSKLISGRDALQTIREVPSNQYCADCRAEDPDWASINLGIVVCIECSGIHRSLGVHFSKVRSLPLDEWEPELIQLMKAIGNENANKVWEAKIPDDFERVLPGDEREVKTDFIKSKYVDKLFFEPVLESQDPTLLSQKFFEAVKLEDVMETVKILGSGVNINSVDPSTGYSALHFAAEAGKIEQIELILQNGANPLVTDLNGNKADQIAKKNEYFEVASRIEDFISKTSTALDDEIPDDEEVKIQYRCGYLFKRGGSNKFWKRRWFTFEEGALRYFKLKEDKEPAGVVMIGDMVGIWIKEDPLKSKPHYFELLTCFGRFYELAADNESQMMNWHDILGRAIDANNVKISFSPGNFDVSSCEMHGILNKKTETQTKYLPRWFVLRGKSLYYFKNDQDRNLLGSVDLRIMTHISEFSGDETKRTLTLKTPNRTFFLEASTPQECNDWIHAIKNTQIFGVPIDIVAQRKQGSHDRGVPLIIVKCVSFITSKGSELPNIYKNDGDPSTINKIKNLFNHDDLAVNLNLIVTESLELYSVARLMIIYFEELPEPLFPTVLYDEILGVMTRSGSKYFDEEFVEILKKAPEINIRTLRKLVNHLEQIAQRSEVNLMTRKELSEVFAKCLFRKTSKPSKIPEEEFELLAQFLEYLMQNSNTTFKEALPNITPRKPQRPRNSLVIESRSSITESEAVATFDILIDNGPLSFPTPITDKTTVKEICYNLVKKVVSATPTNMCTNYSLFEISPEYERPLEDEETMLSVWNSWVDAFNCTLVFKFDPIRTVPITLRDSFPFMVGWLYKEGVSVKSWKKRYFVLRPTGLAYYKDSKNLSSEVGMINYHDLYVSYVLNHKKAPAKYCFALRTKNLGKNLSLKNPTPTDFVCRILCSETSSEREAWMAAIIQAKLRGKENPEIVSRVQPQAQLRGRTETNPVSLLSRGNSSFSFDHRTSSLRSKKNNSVNKKS